MVNKEKITDFFKPFAIPPNSKRSRQESESDYTIKNGRSASKSPRLQDAPNSNDDLQDGLSSSMVSSLTPLSSSDDIMIEGGDPMRVDVSFASLNPYTSTASDPYGSFALGLTSSQRVMKNGQIVVTNSDGESDSDASLDDVDELLMGTKHSELPYPTEVPLPSLPFEGRTRQNGRKEILHRAKKETPTQKADASSSRLNMPKYKFSIDSLIAQVGKEDAAEAGAQQARLAVRALHEQRKARDTRLGSIKKEDMVEEGLLASIMKNKGSNEGIDRLMQAIKRTEALHHDKTWLFFDSKSQDSQEPPHSVPNMRGSFQIILSDPRDRQQAFLNGYVRDIAAKGRLSDEMLIWIIDEMCSVNAESLQNAYLKTLGAASSQMGSLFSISRIDQLFQRLGARHEALDLKQTVEPISNYPPSDGSDSSPNWSRLVSVLKLLKDMAAHMNADARTHTICLLCRMSLDSTVTGDSEVIIALENVLVELVDSIPVSDFEDELVMVMNTTFQQIPNTQLRLSVLKNLPATPCRLSILRRRLALSYFFEDSTFSVKLLKDLVIIQDITNHLRLPRFMIKSSTDYVNLSALMSILDIGLSDARSPDSDEFLQRQRAFNQRIDELASTIKTMFTQIIDTGASHMSRTEGRDVLESFHSRLIFAMRTEIKPKKDLFGDSKFMNRKDQEGAFLKSFLVKTE